MRQVGFQRLLVIMRNRFQEGKTHACQETAKPMSRRKFKSNAKLIPENAKPMSGWTRSLCQDDAKPMSRQMRSRSQDECKADVTATVKPMPRRHSHAHTLNGSKHEHKHIDAKWKHIVKHVLSLFAFITSPPSISIAHDSITH